MQTLAVLGATGSIGESTLAILREHTQRYQLLAVSAHKQLDKLISICQEFQPQYIALACPEQLPEFQEKAKSLNYQPTVLLGNDGLETIAALPEVDTVVSAIVGAAGLLPTLAAINASKRVLLANKESLVMAGELMMRAVKASNAVLLPVDSEHNAIFQCLSDSAWQEGLQAGGVKKLILTASGGPFLDKPVEELARVTPEQACAHPNWDMGRKISIDSATMMNKGLEVIEACWLFNAPIEQVDVVIHPQSIVHSMVEYQDGSVLAQLGMPDMRTPIAYALSWPERIDVSVPRLDFSQTLSLDFIAPDLKKFPCLQLAFDAMKRGGTAPAVLNAANEIAVELFLDKRIQYTDIALINAAVLEQSSIVDVKVLDDVLNADKAARELAVSFGEKIAQGALKEAIE